MLYSCSQKEDLQLAEKQSSSSTIEMEQDKDLALLKDGANGTDGKGGEGGDGGKGGDGDPLLWYCDCDIYKERIKKFTKKCEEEGDVYPEWCRLRDIAIQDYEICQNLPPQCPEGFVYDGKNCYSGIHIPQGFRGFIWRNGFYVAPNCDKVGEDGKPVLVEVDENCCPPGFGFDGKNCHYWGVYIPKEYDGGFIYNNAFYARPACKS